RTRQAGALFASAEPVQDLFYRTLSEAIQALFPAAVWLVWLRRTGRAGLARAVRNGMLTAVPLTVIVGWLFESTSYQARWESLLAASATAVAFACIRVLAIGSRSDGAPSGRTMPAPSALPARLAATAATALIIVRQTML